MLADEVGLDPGAALVELEKAVLAQDGRVLREATRPPERDVRAACTGGNACSAGVGVGVEPATGRPAPFLGREEEPARLTA